MSPTSFQTAPPRDIMLYMICSLLRKYSRKRKWMEVDSNHRSNLQQIYSLSPLATRESAHSISSCIILTEKYYSIAADCLQEISCMHSSSLVATHNLEKFVFEFPELSRQSPKSRASTDLVSLLRAKKRQPRTLPF